MVLQANNAMSFFGDGNLMRISQLPKTVILSPVAKDLPECSSFKHTLLAPSPKTGIAGQRASKTAFVLSKFQEILRPKLGHWMTGSIHPRMDFSEQKEWQCRLLAF